MRKRASRIGILTSSAIGLAMAMPAFAQSASGNADETEITVTGSRIKSPNDTSAQPVTAIAGAQLQESGAVTVADAINELPQFGNAFGGQNQDINTANAGFNIGTELINLRNLGAQRTLVLVNGRRHVAGDPGTSAVDLNSIPAGMIDRIDVVTGANSSVYGADAVSGVVNIILKDRFEGTDLNLRGGITTEGDGREIGASITHGGRIGDRTRYLAAIEYSDRNPIFGRDRSWVLGDGSTNSFGFSTGSAAVESGPFTTNVGAFVITPRGTIPWTTASVGPDYRYQRVFDRNLQTANRRLVASAKLDFELSDTVNLFWEGSFAKTKAQVDFEPQFFFFRSINAAQFDLPPVPTSNPFLAPFLASVGATTLIQGTGTTRRLAQYGSRFAKVDRDLYRTAIGLNGEVGQFDFEAYYQYGRVQSTQEDGPSIDRNRMAAALNNCATGNGVYGLAGVNYQALGCVPFNPFGNGNLSQAFIDYTLIKDVKSTITNDQHVVSAYLSGDLFKLMGSDLKAVLGAEHRSENTSTRVHPSLQDRSNGIRQIAATQGSTSVTEVFGELRLPMLDDKLEIGGAARYSDYSTVGGQFTWNVSGSYQPVPFIRLRASYGEAIRAPNVNELFSAVSDTTGTLRDPCANDFNNNGLADAGVTVPVLCTSQLGAAYVITEDPSTGSVLRFRRGGNSALRPENAKTFTVGGVFSFPSVAGLNLSVDYYSIKLTDVIGSLVPSTVVAQCYGTNPNSALFCPLISRSPGGQLLAVNTQIFNVASEDVQGLDVQIRVAGEIGPGRASFSANYAHLFKRTRTDFAGVAPTVLTGRIDAPRDQFNATVIYKVGSVEIGYTGRVLGSALKGTSAANLADPNNRIPTYWYHDLRLSFAVNDLFTFDVGAKNLGNKAPPIISEFSNSGLVGSGGITAGGIYDVRGRFLYAQFGVRF